MHYAIIAAGHGSRLARDGAGCSKPLTPIDGRPMIQRLLELFLGHEAESINVVINGLDPKVEELLSHIRSRLPSGLLRYVVARTPSSMHSFHKLSPLLAGCGRFCLTTVDTVFSPAEFSKYMEQLRSLPQEYGLMGVTDFVDDEKPLYVETDSAMNIHAFSDTPPLPRSRKLVSAGVYALPQEALKVLDLCVTEGVRRMRNYQRALLSHHIPLKARPLGKVIDVDRLSDLKKAQSSPQFSQLTSYHCTVQ